MTAPDRTREQRVAKRWLCAQARKSELRSSPGPVTLLNMIHNHVASDITNRESLAAPHAYVSVCRGLEIDIQKGKGIKYRQQNSQMHCSGRHILYSEGVRKGGPRKAQYLNTQYMKEREWQRIWLRMLTAPCSSYRSTIRRRQREETIAVVIEGDF